jgi:hypothetical protein
MVRVKDARRALAAPRTARILLPGRIWRPALASHPLARQGQGPLIALVKILLLSFEVVAQRL